MIRKVVHSQDSYFKFKPTKSGETSINLSNEILNFLTTNPQKGTSTNVVFKLFKEDYLRAIGFLSSQLPLYTSSSQSSDRKDLSVDFFSSLLMEIEELFKENDTVDYSVNLFYREDGRIYLNNLKYSGFNLRHFLLEDCSVLYFDKQNDVFLIRLKFERNNYLIKEKKINVFADRVIRLLNDYDNLESLQPYFINSQKGYIQIEYDGMTLYRFLNPDVTVETRGKRWTAEDIDVKGNRYLICAEWTELQNSSSVPCLDYFKQIVDSLYNHKFVFDIEDGMFILRLEESPTKISPINHYSKVSTTPISIIVPHNFLQYISAIKTKPFVLLAGISGTGKSRIVRQLARACDTLDENPWTVQTPQNFEMIQVRPDWHDSSELLGYESRISGKAEYVVKNFVKFIVKAWLHEDVPFFLCLDEMNLAPVEQYFAEYLSVVESRRLDEQGNIACDPLIKLNRQHCQSIVNEMLAPSESDDTDANQLNQAEEMMILLEGMDYTLPLPQNLIVMGTVNMDETTFSFSRKVLDRAMTIEMNEVDLKGGLIDTEKERFHVNAQDILPNAVEGKDVYATNQPLCDRVIKFLEEVNEVLEGTPFKIAYRTRNEFLLYAVNRGEEHFEEALDEMTSMKILSRIEGDQDKVGDVLDQLKTVLEKNSIPTEGKSLPKITEMNKKLDKGYTSYWS